MLYWTLEARGPSDAHGGERSGGAAALHVADTVGSLIPRTCKAFSASRMQPDPEELVEALAASLGSSGVDIVQPLALGW